jgi:hypothetical protein
VAESAPGLKEALAWVGFKLDDIGGATTGRVEGVLVDGRSGTPTWLVIRVGRLGHRSAVPATAAAGGVGHVWVPYPRDLIRSSPEIDPGAAIGPEREAVLREHYGIPGIPATSSAGSGPGALGADGSVPASTG